MPTKRRRHSPLRSSVEDINASRRVPKTAQSSSSAYRLAFTDEVFMTSEELRGVRFQLEYMKTEMRLKERNINSTVVLFGGARIPAPGKPAWAARNDTQKKNLEAASIYYDEARRFAQYASLTSQTLNYHDFVVITGGGPGVMEAGNRGAADVGAPSIGLNVVLPHEQAPNSFVTPELSFLFHYFATRKVHFLMRARVVAIFPGGFGTMDELFEALTLIQTGRMERIPLLLFGSSFWSKVINFDALVEMGTIAPEDLSLLSVVDTAEEGWAVIQKHYNLPHINLPGFRADS